jgi:hypothetical protein
MGLDDKLTWNFFITHFRIEGNHIELNTTYERISVSFLIAALFTEPDRQFKYCSILKLYQPSK